jgi:hypothetical protein
VAHGVQDIDEVARRTHVAEQRHSRKNFHFIARDVVNAPQLLVVLEIIPGRLGRGLGIGAQQCLRARIGEEV